MPGWDGNGNFVRVFSWVADALAGIKILASRMDTDTNNITNNGFGNCLTRDGQGSATNDLPMNNFRHTGVGNATASDEYATVIQIQDSSYLYTVAGGTADALTGSYNPAITALVEGMLLTVRCGFINTTTTPTFSPNGLTAHPITKLGGKPLLAGDIVGGGCVILIQYNAVGSRWELLNPAFGAVVPTPPWAAAGGTADAITAAYVPANAALTDGLLLSFRASAANATTTPTFAPDGLTAHVITKDGGIALSAGDIAGALAECLVRYNLAHTRWELLNPAGALGQYHSQFITATGTFTIPSGANASTVFKFTGTAGGGASGGTGTSNGATTSGAAGGGTFIAAFSGFTPSAPVTVTVGAGGTRGTSGGGNGTDGADTVLTYSAVAIATAHGGSHTSGNTSPTPATVTGPAGADAVIPGGGGLTLISSVIIVGGDGGVSMSNTTTALSFSGKGGASYWGDGSRSLGSDATFDPFPSRNFGSGGGGAQRQGGTDHPGANGDPGIVLVEWWL